MMEPRDAEERLAFMKGVVASTVAQLTAALPSETASVREGSNEDAVWTDLVPTRPSAAPVRITLPSRTGLGIDFVTIEAGRGSVFEIPARGQRYTEFPLAEELTAICSAVMAGRLEEWVVFKGDQVLRSKAVLGLDRPVTARWGRASLRALWPMWRRSRVHFQYAPWHDV